MEDDGLARSVEQLGDGLQLVKVRQAVGERLGQAGHVGLLLQQLLARLLQTPAAIRDRPVALLGGADIPQALVNLLKDVVARDAVPVQLGQVGPVVLFPPGAHHISSKARWSGRVWARASGPVNVGAPALHAGLDAREPRKELLGVLDGVVRQAQRLRRRLRGQRRIYRSAGSARSSRSARRRRGARRRRRGARARSSLVLHLQALAVFDQ